MAIMRPQKSSHNVLDASGANRWRPVPVWEGAWWLLTRCYCTPQRDVKPGLYECSTVP
ncbi:hypothetical protein LMG9964_04201 [Paraburkholderia phenoliruptrix]|uniref:Uncharacterized protein n=1 Tax=Paraburkholderia phenoliruptrix TaxID=252970 RepID=A0A6J5KC76_9BURK|nr:hypothetical protein LMG9964_04201 [Paraburkholderia phenoliruptrix]